MDGSTIEHSDSDSGESWTLLENIPTHGDGAPSFPENLPISCEGENIEVHTEKDDDTDGISIISDSDHESSPCDVNHVKLVTDDNNQTEENTPLLATPPSLNINHNNESLRDQTDFLGDNVKYKTYVHRRNPKVGTILDIIMLGTFIITAGMALGHLWSCKNECTTQTSVNKILSNLYKLQEENDYLRNKLKEITQATNYQLVQQLKTTNNKIPTKQHRCKKIFEEPVIKNNEVEHAVRCITDKQPDVALDDPLVTPEYEKEFLKDVDKMKDIYNTNKNWIDAEVKKQFKEIAKSNNAKDETNFGLNLNKQNNLNNQLGPILTPVDKNLDLLQDIRTEPTNIKKPSRHTNLEKQLGPIYYENPFNTETDMKDDKTETNVIKSHRQIHLELQLGPDQNTNLHNPESVKSDESFEILPEKKITYADSLKIDQPWQRNQRSDNNGKPRKWIQENVGKKKHEDNKVSLNLSTFSEDDINDVKKDDRYTGPKVKHEKKKHDRQKSHNKQKRNNKYEQWEMKGGYQRDYDEFSVTSSQDNDITTNKPEKKFLNPDFENYINKLIETERNISKKDPKTTRKFNEKPNKVEKVSLKGKKGKNKNSEWYDERSALRSEARMKLVHELFGENTSNNAAWYFRRMQKREQCRAQKDNSLFKKLAKQKMNFKTKR